MKIKKISLTNFRQYKSEEIEFPESNFIVCIGINGSGKTTVLDGIAMCLSHLIGRLTSQKDEYQIQYSIGLKDILNGQTESKVSLDMIFEGKNLNITVSKEIDQKGNSFKINPEKPVRPIREKLLLNSIENLPILVYYRANRSFFIKDNVKSGSYYNNLLNGYRFTMDNNTSAYSPFQNWIISQEGIENEKKIEKKDFNYELKSLIPIRRAVERFLTLLSDNRFINLRGRRKEDSNFNYGNELSGELIIDKNNDTVKLSQLSSGERALISIVVDIAVRLTILNNASAESLEGKGIVIIDELEIHLHPKWQRNIIPALKDVFPKIQFITTTHSPQIISSVSNNEILVLENKTHFSLSSNPLGRDSNGILEEVFETYSRPREVDKLISQIFRDIDDSNHDTKSFSEKIKNLKELVADDDPILSRIDSIRTRIKILNS